MTNTNYLKKQELFVNLMEGAKDSAKPKDRLSHLMVVPKFKHKTDSPNSKLLKKDELEMVSQLVYGHRKKKSQFF